MEKKLPKNWVETELGNYVALKNGYAFKSTDFQSEGIPVIRISNIQEGKIDLNYSICVDASKAKKDFIINRGDILIAMSGATTGKFGVYNLDEISLQNQRVGNLKPVVEELSNKMFIYYLLGNLREEIEQRAYGGAQPNISPKLIESIVINLPPLSEQNRIVEKLDRFFGQLEVIKTSMEKIPVLLKNFRQQVLTQAVTGKLTEEWREGKELEEWKTERLGDVCNLKAGKFVSASEIQNENQEGYFSCYGGNGLRGFVKSYTHTGRYSLIGRQGALCGNVHLVEGQFYATEHALVATPTLDIDEVWLFYKLTSLELINYSKGVAQPGLSVMNLNPILLSVPGIKEQKENVSRLESLFAKADTIEEKYKNLKTKIETLPQTILHKAFKGELSEQLETDGDARDLLEEIAALKNGGKAKKAVAKKYVQPDEVLRIVAEADATE